MKLPCAKQIPFVVCGLSFLQPAMTNIQYQNLTLIATALILGSKFNLTEISLMWLKEKSVSALSEFLSDAKLSTDQMQQLYQLRTQQLYKITGGYFIIDDTMVHHTKFCKWIHGVNILFDHAFGTNLKAKCIVFLYFNDGNGIKFFIDFRIFYKEDSKMPWYRKAKYVHKKKYDLAIEMIDNAIKNGLPACMVLAD
ncbi:MAG: transposase, partial [Candidatus Marinimicrobia bacterium]|nr:transposase [Candidatus Neomarinimicrobiota bacterium]